MNERPNSLNLHLTVAQRKLVAELLPEFADRLKLAEKSARSIPFTNGELESIRDKAEAGRSDVKTGMKRNSLRHVIDAVAKALGQAEGTGPIPLAARLYQFKITLMESRPPIWRRIQVKDCTLDEFHEHIQTAMGWTNSHLHQFEIGRERYGDPRLLDDAFGEFDGVDSTVARISEIVPKNGRRFRFLYEYDFGDGWAHEILFEKCLEAERGGRYPLCIDGERRCPPEDVGGVWGYADYVEAIVDPKHERHAELIEWAGEFDPEEFDAKETTRAMRRGMPGWDW